MIKLYIGADELPFEYKFNYTDDNTAYNKHERRLSGKIYFPDMSESLKLETVKKWFNGVDLIAVERKQGGYVCNILTTKDIYFSSERHNGDVLFEIDFVRRSKPHISKSVELVSLNNQTLNGIKAKKMIGISVDTINTAGAIYFNERALLWASNTMRPNTEEVGLSRLTSNSTCYVSQGGGSNIKFMSGHGGLPFAGGISITETTAYTNAKITGRVLVIN